MLDAEHPLKAVTPTQVKDQMVWMMLKERKELQDKLDAKTSAYKALEVRHAIQHHPPGSNRMSPRE